ncbi:hypothetical protein [Phycisphaera mikurensis]|uniref:Uncharacterized protein n=1 Tax=Phycisphaera mikurensis (strain NBRC 102666 / KCTC 22515 / FYK2301M01) TaxID=1142394 RepID=I0IC12_PHYMF|nr:hypothetical protein [Phycisphaera mikurensis]MBB6441976.1 hypothetical protein [Phycisphaera mikurensis]BAM02800.1 hypothetical protein PSMK_06410 [Phycisphaera mikurensis NBRC 102666]
MARSFPLRAAAAAAVSVVAAGAAACPLCDTGTGAEVRAGLVDEHLPVSVAAVALPLVGAGLALGAVTLLPSSGSRARGPEAA